MEEYKVHCDLPNVSLDDIPGDPMGDELIELALNKQFGEQPAFNAAEDMWRVEHYQKD